MRKKINASTKKLANANKHKVAIITSAYHEDLNKNMERACIKTLVAAGIPEKNITVFTAPGSWEIPIIAEHIAASDKYNAIATFGVIIKGETYHFDMIANEVGRALMDISITYGLPVALEVLAVYSVAQAKKRTQGEYNKGTEAANAILQTLETLHHI